MKSVWKEERTKATNQALQLSSEFFKLFTLEAIHRSAEEAKQQSDLIDEIGVEHLEKITTQLMLDF
ncbi:unnamed protein product [Cunninghamella blakesleeana]